MTRSDRGQAHTLEGVAAAIIVVTSVVLALQMTAVTPLTASTANQHVETQERAAARGVLATAGSGGLREAALYWNTSAAGFVDAGATGYYNGSVRKRVRKDVPLLAALSETFADRDVAYDVSFVYHTASGTRQSRRFVYQGDPTENAVTVGRTVTLYDDDRPAVAPNASESTLADAPYFAPDAAPGSPVYTTVTVEVTVWRM